MTTKKDFLRLDELTKEQLLNLLARAEQYQRGLLDGDRHQPLKGRSLAMLFSKPSTRTRVSFEVGVFQLGGHAVMLSDRDSQIGRGEPIADTARVLSGYVDGIMIRTFDHADVEALARFAQVPVINGLTDFNHPCQVLADLLTCQTVWDVERLSSMTVAWCGDGNNMARSWLHASSVLGFELRLASPEAYALSKEEIDNARDHGARVAVCDSPRMAAEGAHVVTTDVWASMGQEAEAVARHRLFEPFRIDESIMAVTDAKSIFLHCLPVHRGEEVTSAVVDGPKSQIWAEAENRLHAQKAILEWTMGGFSID